MRYSERATLTKNPAAKELFLLMDEKKTNLGVSCDLTDPDTFLALVDAVGPHAAVIKTHIDIIEDFDSGVVSQLLALKKEHRFMIFEDRKFADIGNTVQMQYANGVHRIADWADITNAHSVPGPGVIEGLRKIGLPKGRGLLLLAQMSSEGNLATGSYTEQTIEWAKKYSDFVIGFIGMKKLIDDPQFITMTPGVHLDHSGDALHQQYATPQAVIAAGSDVQLVGRGIYTAPDPVAAAKEYQEAGFEAYEDRLKQ